MRSREGSEASGPSAAGEETRMLYTRRSPRASDASYEFSGPRSEASSQGRSPANQTRSRLSYEFDEMASQGRSPQNQTELAARDRASAVNNAEMRKLIEHIGHSCIDKSGSLHMAMKDLKTDAKGDLRRGDVRRFFEQHHVATRMADRFFDSLTKRRRCDAIGVDELKEVFDVVVGQHHAKNSSKNVHGLLRPKNTDPSILAMNNPMHASQGNLGDDMDPERLKRIAKLMVGKEQRKFISKSGKIDREELQTLFWTYGLKAKQSNDLFDSIDTNRDGEISFKELNTHLGGFLGVEDDSKKKRADCKTASRDVLGHDEMLAVCDLVGTKAAQKHRRVYDAFRFVDKDGDDRVDRWEVRNFFRAYGSKTKMADLFFDTLDRDKQGTIGFVEFEKQFTPWIQPGYNAPITQA
jgi:Ca2+-binding EF-hand superfamily protein